MTTPFPALKPGQKIGVMAPSSTVERDDIEASATVMRDRGYEVFVHPQTFEREGQSAGTVLQKSMAIQGLWQRADIDAVWCAGGGNQAMPLLKSINFEAMGRKQKTLLGFSDATVLLNGIAAHTGCITHHAPVFKNLHKMGAAQLDLCFAYLEGRTRAVVFDADQIIKAGVASGTLVGGNLSLAQYLPALLPDDYFDGAILFLEDCHEEFSRIERMFCYLSQSGLLDKISGLMLGQFTDLQDTGRPFGMNMDDILARYMQNLDIPIVKNLAFGHDLKSDFIPFPVGAMCEIDTGNHKILW